MDLPLVLEQVSEQTLSIALDFAKMVSINEPDQNLAPSDSSEEADILDLQDDEGWEDQEPDVEQIEVLCLGCSQTFPDAQSMLPHCRDTHKIDIAKVQKTLSA